jgi:hypothetical protein
MFSCAVHPISNRAFPAEVRIEAEEAACRVSQHASMTLWCSNNELEAGLAGPAPTLHVLPTDYDALHNETSTAHTDELTINIRCFRKQPVFARL